MEKNLTGKIALVTGGSRGIGYATAQEFIERGATVIITGRREAALKLAAATLSAHYLVSDQSRLSDIDQLAAHVAAEWSGLDILFINAGINGAHLPIEQNTEEEFDKVMGINFKGAYFTLSKFIPVLRTGASVVFLSSVAASVATPDFSDYSASKAALNAVARIAALELAPRQIRVNIVSPGPTITGIMENSPLDPETAKAIAEQILGKLPVNRFALASEIAQSVAHLCDPTSGFITGTELLIDGGYSLRN